MVNDSRDHHLVTPPPALPADQAQPIQHGVERLTAWFDRFNRWLAPDMADGASPTAMARRPILIGAYTVLFVFGFLLLWSALAPLDSAAVAPGKIILSGNKKTIQHLEGGVVEAILIHEGDTVKAGQPLVKLNQTAALARADLFRKQYVATLAADARLRAERDNKDEIALPKQVTDAAAKDPEVAELVASQQELFTSRRNALKSQADILDQKMVQSRQDISGLNAQIASATRQISLLQSEISSVTTLLAAGNASRPRLLALQRQQAELQGNRGQYQSNISRANQEIGETQLQKTGILNDFQNKVASELKENQEKLTDLEERVASSKDVMSRIVIAAPLSGVVTDLQAHTIGGVIRPGDKIMDIVPIDQMVVEARVSPTDIDVVHAGLPARVRLTAYKTRQVPPIDGKVLYVSADRFDDPKSNQSYYLARVKIDEAALKAQPNVTLTPGMPADTLIVTGTRTLLGYLFTPITDSFRHAFREQ